MVYRMQEIRCPQCDAPLNATDEPIGCETDGPGPDDFTVCLYCSHLMVFNADMSVRSANKKETKQAEDLHFLDEAREVAKMFRIRYAEEIERRKSRKN